MATFIQKNASLWISKKPETAFNTPFTLGSEFLKATTVNPVVLLPEMEKTNDAGKAGNGHEFATYICNRYWLPMALSLQDDVNFDLAGRLLLRALSGSVTDSTIDFGIEFKHECSMLPVASGLQMLSQTVISELGGASFLFPGAVVERYRLGQDGAAPPTFQADFVSSGKHKRPHAVTSLPTSTTTIAGSPCGAKSKSEVKWTDAGGLQDFTTGLCILRSWFCEVVNNHAPTDDRCPGDPEQDHSNPADTTGPGVASYLNRLSHGDRVVNAQIVILLDSTIPEWIQMAENEVITDVTFTATGPPLTNGHASKVTMIIPQARIASIQEIDSNGKAALAINLLAMYDSVSGGALKAQVINDINGLNSYR